MSEDKQKKDKEAQTHDEVDPLADVVLLDPKEDAVKQLKKSVRALLGMSKDSKPEELAQRLMNNLNPQGKDKLLFDLVVREFSKRIASEEERTARMNELVGDAENGAYPYANAYDTEFYEEELYGLQIELLKLQKYVKETGGKIIIVFEGRDAAGKGGTIGRFIENLNPRGARIVALPKPTDAEKGQWYFQRYVRQLPDPGEIVLFDRSWYNRAVVEPVMGFCTEQQTEQFLREVLFFEKSIVEGGVHLVKFWLDVGRQEQKRRFKARRTDPLKRWKLSPVDVASLEKWEDYTYAIEEMFKQTDAPYAPWTIIRSDEKKRARLNALRMFLSEIDYPEKDHTIIGKVDGRIVLSASEYLRLPKRAKF